jgi:uncharacterized membrane protein
MKQALALITLTILLILPAQALATSDHIEYNITLNPDGSATWKIIQATDTNTAVDTLEQFQQKILNTINTARNNTARQMELDFSSLEMKTDMHWETSSQTIEYIFRWENFSTSTEGKIVFGDVFSGNFFATFYGNGELYVTYPTQYSLNTASPRPDEANNTTQTLHWYRTQDFPATQPNITLTKNAANNNLSLSALAIASTATAAMAVAAFLLFNRRKHQKQNAVKPVTPAPWMEKQNSQEKILQLLKSSGGSITQSEICSTLRFSRAKTSLLLAEMEKTNQVRRDKKGKTKIVHIQK